MVLSEGEGKQRVVEVGKGKETSIVPEVRSTSDKEVPGEKEKDFVG
jgi:hypothetical protein